jgi:DNA-binding Lrp family transcriptional regulator
MDRSISKKLVELKQVKFATTIYGEWDLLAEVKVESLPELDRFVFDNFRQIPGVEGTKTLIATKIVKEEN